MLSFTILVLFSVLLLTPTVGAVCSVCFGQGVGCDGTGNQCPWNTDVTANFEFVRNALAGTATAATAVKIAKVVPLRLRRIFDNQVLGTICAIVTKVRNGANFDPEGKSYKQIHYASCNTCGHGFTYTT